MSKALMDKPCAACDAKDALIKTLREDCRRLEQERNQISSSYQELQNHHNDNADTFRRVAALLAGALRELLEEEGS